MGMNEQDAGKHTGPGRCTQRAAPLPQQERRAIKGSRRQPTQGKRRGGLKALILDRVDSDARRETHLKQRLQNGYKVNPRARTRRRRQADEVDGR